MVSRKVIFVLSAVVIAATLISLFIHSRLQTGTDNGLNDTFPDSQVLPSPKAVLKVGENMLSAYWARDSTTDLPDYVSNIQYSVSNYGNANAVNVSLVVYVDGSLHSSNTIPILLISQTETFLFSTITPYDSSSNVLIQASCQASSDSYSFTVGSDLPRYWSEDPDVVKLFVTPKEADLVEMKNAIIENKFFLLPNWIALRDWVGNNVEYKHDSEAYGQEDYWQLSKETLGFSTGDCEDYAILLCSLLRADGWSANDAFVVLGKNSQNQYHAWAKVNLGILGWYNLEPQQDGWSTLIGDFLSLSGYSAMYEFNDLQFKQIG